MRDNQCFKGVMTALATPLDNDGNVNPAVVADLIEFQLSAGIGGFYLCGGTGEGIVLSPENRMKMVEAAVTANRGRGKIIVQTGAVRPEEAFLLAEHAVRWKADGISSVPPSLYYQYTESETVDYYRELAKRAASLPVLIYRTPAFSIGGMVSLMEKLLSIDNIIGLKYTGSSYYEMWKLLQLNSGNINVINGADETLLCGLVTGAQGGIGAVYNLIPEEFAALYGAFAAGDLKEAQRRQNGICRCIAGLGKFIRGAGIILPVKVLLDAMGFPVGKPAYPCQLYPEETREQLIANFKELKASLNRG
ncbi:MAG: dihydrodipicolinate synthase family protein [Lentisphaeria bacterium]|nr:dihydrodipicolinate synthase family protein [Lentisphaeria bacterium]